VSRAKPRSGSEIVRLEIGPGSAQPLGATWDGDGVSFALFSEHASSVELCLFDADGSLETARVALSERSGDVFHGRVPGLRPGQLYASPSAASRPAPTRSG
jgi:glycogen operon protein